MPEENTHQEEPKASPDAASDGTEAFSINFANVDYSGTKNTRFYANHVGAQISVFDLRLLLSNVHVTEGKLMADETVTVFVSPEMAFLLLNALTNSLQTYQQRFGTLRLGGLLPLVQTEPPPQQAEPPEQQG